MLLTFQDNSAGKLNSFQVFKFHLFVAQREPCGVGIKYKDKGGNGTRGHLLDESGEYILVYEDNEGDRMLVGDVPWQ